MSRVVLIHWKAEESQERIERLRHAGHAVQFLMPQGGKGLAPFRRHPPDAFVIDLSRLPSHGRAVGIFLRQQKPTRHVPLVFVAGAPDKLAATRRLLPDAIYTGWDGIGEAIRLAFDRTPARPVVPGTMAGYSATPLPKKLGLRSQTTVALLGAPAGFARRLDPVPERVRFVKRLRPRSAADLVLLFTKSRADLGRRFPAALRGLAAKGGLWIVWPKRSSGVPSDLEQTAVRAFGLAAGLVDYKICAVDATWSGLLFTRRRSRHQRLDG
jgi:hypothetical protein